MLSKPGILLIALFAGFISACNHHSIDETKNVNDVIFKLIEADNNADIQTVLRSYTDNIEFYPAGKDFTKGINNIQKSYEKMFKENKLAIKTQIIETKVFGNDAMVTGINKGTRMALPDSSIHPLNDKYIALLVRTSAGEWKIDKLIWGIDH